MLNRYGTADFLSFFPLILLKPNIKKKKKKKVLKQQPFPVPQIYNVKSYMLCDLYKNRRAKLSVTDKNMYSMLSY